MLTPVQRQQEWGVAPYQKYQVSRSVCWDCQNRRLHQGISFLVWVGELCQHEPICKGFPNNLFTDFYGGKGLVQRSEEFFGLVRCDIHLFDHLTENVLEMALIFRKGNISHAHLRERMKSFAVDNVRLNKPTRTLIVRLHGSNILLFIELLVWLLRHRLFITNIYAMYQYIPRRLYKSFGDSVSNTRWGGDVGLWLVLLADTGTTTMMMMTTMTKMTPTMMTTMLMLMLTSAAMDFYPCLIPRLY